MKVQHIINFMLFPLRVHELQSNTAKVKLNLINKQEIFYLSDQSVFLYFIFGFFWCLYAYVCVYILYLPVCKMMNEQLMLKWLGQHHWLLYLFNKPFLKEVMWPMREAQVRRLFYSVIQCDIHQTLHTCIFTDHHGLLVVLWKPSFLSVSPLSALLFSSLSVFQRRSFLPAPAPFPACTPGSSWIITHLCAIWWLLIHSLRLRSPLS